MWRNFSFTREDHTPEAARELNNDDEGDENVINNAPSWGDSEFSEAQAGEFGDEDSIFDDITEEASNGFIREIPETTEDEGASTATQEFRQVPRIWRSYGGVATSATNVSPHQSIKGGTY